MFRTFALAAVGMFLLVATSSACDGSSGGGFAMTKSGGFSSGLVRSPQAQYAKMVAKAQMIQKNQAKQQELYVQREAKRMLAAERARKASEPTSTFGGVGIQARIAAQPAPVARH